MASGGWQINRSNGFWRLTDWQMKWSLEVDRSTDQMVSGGWQIEDPAGMRTLKSFWTPRLTHPTSRQPGLVKIKTVELMSERLFIKTFHLSNFLHCAAANETHLPFEAQGLSPTHLSGPSTASRDTAKLSRWFDTKKRGKEGFHHSHFSCLSTHLIGEKSVVWWM